MLRGLFGESRRKDEGLLLEANRAICKFINELEAVPAKRRTEAQRRFRVWADSFYRAIDELEQSEYAAVQYARLVKSRYVDEMNREEKDNYNRHLYYYKNALIRLFAVLDKLGYFMNESLQLGTERMKARFSYFTVLRNMRQHKLHPGLGLPLNEMKERFREPVSRLRNVRNMEIHTINADLLDDLLKAGEARRGENLRTEIEDIPKNLDDLCQGSEMALRAVAAVFRYLPRS